MVEKEEEPWEKKKGKRVWNNNAKANAKPNAVTTLRQIKRIHCIST